MFDDVRAYPGDVHIIVSGTAASAATVLARAADRLEMTPGSMWMIHDPSVFAFGNEHDLNDAIRMGNRLIMMHEGRIIYDVRGDEKRSLTVKDLLQKFEEVSGGELANDRMLLS